MKVVEDHREGVGEGRNRQVRAREEENSRVRVQEEENF